MSTDEISEAPKCSKIRFRLGLCTKPHWGSSQHFPRPCSCIEKAYF